MAVERLEQFLSTIYKETEEQVRVLIDESTSFLLQGEVDLARLSFERTHALSVRIREIGLIRNTFVTPNESENRSRGLDTPPEYNPSEKLLQVLTPKGKPSARRIILELFLLSEHGQAMHVRGIVRATGREINEVRRELQTLQDTGILVSHESQNRRVYSLSQDPEVRSGAIIPLTTLLHFMRVQALPVGSDSQVF